MKVELQFVKFCPWLSTCAGMFSGAYMKIVLKSVEKANLKGNERRLKQKNRKGK